MRRPGLIAWTAALAAAFGWGVLPALTRSIWTEPHSSTTTASVFLFLRFSSSLLSFSLWLILRKRPVPLSTVVGALRSGDLPVSTLVAWSLVTIANFWIQTLALAQIPAGLYALIFALHPIIGVLWMQKGGMGTRDLFGIALVLGGTILFGQEYDFAGNAPSFWAWVALFGGMGTWLAYSTLSRPFHQAGIGTEAMTWLTLALGVISSLPTLLAARSAMAIVAASPRLAGVALIAGWVGMAAFALYQLSLKLNPRAAFLAQYAEPVAALAAAALLLHEPLSIVQLAAALLSILGLASLMRQGSAT